jgi:uncharacterized Zn finger protein
MRDPAPPMEIDLNQRERDKKKAKEKEIDIDTGKGRFETIEVKDEEQLKVQKSILEALHPHHGGWFRIGEVIEIRGSRFRVKAVKPTELRLKLLPKEN